MRVGGGDVFLNEFGIDLRVGSFERWGGGDVFLNEFGIDLRVGSFEGWGGGDVFLNEFGTGLRVGVTHSAELKWVACARIQVRAGFCRGSLRRGSLLARHS